MRSTLLCVFFTLIIQREDVWAQFDDFRPTPIPLNEWHHDKRDNRAGTLHETFRTSAPPTVAVVPAHYWEDALRHSVYLTLVRDKIDQLIAKGDVTSPNSKPNGYDSKEIDDHDLWDKIKSAPFDRIPEEEPASFGDVTIMAKGRLLERNGGFRFAEDERTKEKCSQNNCLQDVKAFWSVKRVRQRDQEMSQGKYHYELTFSVISQTPQKQRKPYENPIRTFTVKESSPAKIFENPKEYNRFPQAQVSRPERAIWVHKNIAPSKFVGRKQYVSGLERIFSSLFSDDDDRSYETPTTKYKQNSYFPPGTSQYSKIGHVGIPVDAHQQIPYPYRPQPIKHVRPPLQAPPTNINQYQYQEILGSPTTANSIPYVQYPYDHRQESSQIGKTTRPAVLPTPLPPISTSMEQSAESMNTMLMENINNTFRPDGIRFHKTYNKYNTPVKVNYFSDHVRPPVYNAPPGVFVTMDKKPFKPMPPLKLVHSKPHKTYKPKDFRPSPQIIDQPPDEDLFSETDFRPMKINFSDDTSSQKSVIPNTNKKTESKIRKPSTSAKKHPKKHDNVKSHRFTATTAVPDIITAQINVEEEIENMAWANILGSLTKTTPIDPQTEMPIIEVTTPMTTSTTKMTTTPQKKVSTTTEAEREITTPTTMKPKRRTRPPPKFTKEEKVKKHKRITTTTTTTTTNAPESALKRRPTNDLTLQASSSPIIPLKPRSTSTSTTSTITTTSSTTTTTSKPTTTTSTTQTPTTSKPTVSTTQPKNKNRFRQSTLMLKGTSVKHDRWSTNAMQKNQAATTSMPPSSYLHRRKGSNFQGYVTSTTTRYVDEEKEREKENHIDHKLKTSPIETTTKMSEIASQTNMYEETVDQYEVNNVMPLQKVEENNNDNTDSEEESKDKAEYIFEPTLSQLTVNNNGEDQTTPKSKSKCKRKKQNISTTVISSSEDSEATTATALNPNLISAKNSKDITTTESDILQDFMNYSFSENDKTTTAELLQEESSNHESYAKFEDDLKDFLGVFKDKKAKEESLIDDEYSEEESDDNQDDEDNNEQDSDEDDSESDEDDYEESKILSIDDDIGFNSDENKETTDDLQYKDESEPKAHSYSFLELMAMS